MSTPTVVLPHVVFIKPLKLSLSDTTDADTPSYVEPWIRTDRLLPNSYEAKEFGFGVADFRLLHNRRNTQTASLDKSSGGSEDIKAGMYIKIVEVTQEQSVEEGIPVVVESQNTKWLGFIEKVSLRGAMDASGSAGSVVAYELGHLAAKTGFLRAKTVSNREVELRINVLQSGARVLGNYGDSAGDNGSMRLQEDLDLLGIDDSKYPTVGQCLSAFIPIAPFGISSGKDGANWVTSSAAEHLTNRVKISIDASNSTLKQYIDAVIRPEAGYSYKFIDNDSYVTMNIFLEGENEGQAISLTQDEMIDIDHTANGTPPDALRVRGNKIRFMTSFGRGTLDKGWSEEQEAAYWAVAEVDRDDDKAAAREADRHKGVFTKFLFKSTSGRLLKCRQEPWSDLSETNVEHLALPRVDWDGKVLSVGTEDNINLATEVKPEVDKTPFLAEARILPMNVLPFGTKPDGTTDASAQNKSTPDYMPAKLWIRVDTKTDDRNPLYADAAASEVDDVGSDISPVKIRAIDYGLGFFAQLGTDSTSMARNHVADEESATTVCDWEDNLVTMTLESDQYVEKVVYNAGYDVTNARRYITLKGDYDCHIVAKNAVMGKTKLSGFNTLQQFTGGTSVGPYHSVVKNDFARLEQDIQEMSTLYFRRTASGSVTMAGVEADSSFQTLALGDVVTTVTVISKDDRSSSTEYTFNGAIKGYKVTCNNDNPRITYIIGSATNINGSNTYDDIRNVRSIGASVPVSIRDVQDRLHKIEHKRSRDWIEPGGGGAGAAAEPYCIIGGGNELVGSYSGLTYQCIKYSETEITEVPKAYIASDEPDDCINGIGWATTYGGKKLLVVNDLEAYTSYALLRGCNARMLETRSIPVSGGGAIVCYELSR